MKIKTIQMKNFWPYYFEKRRKLDIPVRLIAADTQEAIALKKRDREELRQTRLVPIGKFPFGKCEINIFGHYYAYFSYGYEEMIGTLIQDKCLAVTERSLFEFIWEHAFVYDQALR